MQRKLCKDGKIYTVTFDEYYVVDTVECNGKFLPSTNKVVKQILNNATDIMYHKLPRGFTYAD